MWVQGPKNFSHPPPLSQDISWKLDQKHNSQDSICCPHGIPFTQAMAYSTAPKCQPQDGMSLSSSFTDSVATRLPSFSLPFQIVIQSSQRKPPPPSEDALAKEQEDWWKSRDPDGGDLNSGRWYQHEEIIPLHQAFHWKILVGLENFCHLRERNFRSCVANCFLVKTLEQLPKESPKIVLCALQSFSRGLDAHPFLNLWYHGKNWQIDFT